MASEAASVGESTPVLEEVTGSEKPIRRKIPGNLPYTSSPGVLRRVLEKIPTSEKPGVFTSDFLGTVMGATGGAARPVIPILKTAGLLSQTGAPTEIYAQFQTDAGRAAAALQALRKGFGEIFRRNQYAHRADEATLVDIVVAITGLPKKDSIVRYIINTFQEFQKFAKQVREDTRGDEGESAPVYESVSTNLPEHTGAGKQLQLVYNINVVLPETTSVEVYNAIFKSLKANLLT